MIQSSTSIRALALPLLLVAFACGWIALQDSSPSPEPYQPASTQFHPLSKLSTSEPQASPALSPVAISSRDWKPLTPLERSPSTTPAEPLKPADSTREAAASQGQVFFTNPALQSVLEKSPHHDPVRDASFHIDSVRDEASRTRSVSPTWPAMAEFSAPLAQSAFTLPESSGEESAAPPGERAKPAAQVTPVDFSVLGTESFPSGRESPIPIQPEATAVTPPGKPRENSFFAGELPEPHQPTTAAPLDSATSKFHNQPSSATPVPGAMAPTSSSGAGPLMNNPATAYLFESLKPARTTDGFEVPPTLEDFSSPPTNYDSFNPTADMQIYQGKQLFGTQRPLLELGRPWYQLGQLDPPQSWLGFHNPVSQQFLVFGDIRTAVAANQLGGDSQSMLAWQSNLFFDYRLTGTERFHFNITPNTQGANSSRYLFDDDNFISELNADVNFGFFEGDVGAILGGFTNKTLPFDLPIALGVMPLVIQNGVWLDDAFLGAAATIPARNSPLFDISNYDVTFFAGWDKLNSPAFGNDDNAAKLYGIASWWEALNGYIEADYAFVEDRDSVRDRSYHNIGWSYTRRFGHLLSNSTRVLVNAGQSTLGGENTADGVLLLSENSLITANPSTILPYFNLFAGFDRPQSVGRAGIAGGVLRNTGILFESDNLTGYPTLDATANQTYGMALGLSMMPQNFSQQLVLEGAMLGVMGDELGRNAEAAQRGVGFRYQLPLNNSIIFRMDGMYGFLAETEDISGLRVELRRKF